MRATILPKAKGCIVLPLRCFLISLPNYIHICASIMQYFHILTRGKCIATGILPIPNSSLSLFPVGSKISNPEDGALPQRNIPAPINSSINQQSTEVHVLGLVR